MRYPFLVAATAGGWLLAGCSGPAPGSRSAPQADAPTPRDLHRIDAPAMSSVAVSDLEAGRTRTGSPTAVAADKHRPHRPPPTATPASVATAAIDLDQAPILSATSSGAPEISQAVVQAPPVVDMFPAGGLRPAPIGEYAGGEATPSHRDPVIIIRGGRGGVDDDCDLDRPGAHGRGIAINRTAPTFAGGVTVSGRTPRLVGRSGGGFSPRGIR